MGERRGERRQEDSLQHKFAVYSAFVVVLAATGFLFLEPVIGVLHLLGMVEATGLYGIWTGTAIALLLFCAAAFFLTGKAKVAGKRAIDTILRRGGASPEKPEQPEEA